MIALLMGGTSSERELSLETTESFEDSLKRLGLPFTKVDAADPDWFRQIEQLRPEIVLMALHSSLEKGGLVQEILEQHGIRHTGSNAEVRAITIDKIRTRNIIKEMGILTAREFVDEKEVVYPAVVKPNVNGSSCGVSVAHDSDELERAVALAKTYDRDGGYLIEEFIKGTEVTCGVIDVFGEVTPLPLVEIVPDDEFFSFKSKYNPESKTEKFCPARIDGEAASRIQEQSARIFKRLRIGQYARIDWILRGEEPFFLEVNTLPGLRSAALLTKALVTAGIDYDGFIARLIGRQVEVYGEEI